MGISLSLSDGDYRQVFRGEWILKKYTICWSVNRVDWLIGKPINLFSAVIDSRRQNLTSMDVTDIWKTITAEGGRPMSFQGHKNKNIPCLWQKHTQECTIWSLRFLLSTAPFWNICATGYSIRVGHSPDFRLLSVTILPWFCRNRSKAIYSHSYVTLAVYINYCKNSPPPPSVNS